MINSTASADRQDIVVTSVKKKKNNQQSTINNQSTDVASQRLFGKDVDNSKVI